MHPEHNELLALRNQTQTYKDVITELKTHLDNVYSVAGGICVLPLSETAKRVLQTTESLPVRADTVDARAEGLSTPLSLNFGKTRLASQPATTFSPQDCQMTFASVPAEDLASLGYPATTMDMAAPSALHNAIMTPVSAQDVYSFQRAARPDKATMSGGESIEARRHSQLAELVGELQQTISEQRSDIEDLETALRERKTLIRSLRKQLRDKELRQFAAASDHAGLRRTASIMGVPKSALVQLVTAGQLQLPASTPADDRIAAPKPIQLATIASNSSSYESQENEASTNDDHISSDVSSVENARRPSGFINGWPVYDTDQNAKIEHPATLTATNSTDEQTAEQDGDFSDQLLTPPAPPFATVTPASSPRSGTNPLGYKASDGSGLCVSVAETSNSASTASRTPRNFRTIVAKTPRRIYSRLSNRLRKTDI
ncbi:hypothetical protein IWW50_002575 [Coemansia erecta]|nr:hypothetical protein GGF43_001117 [Coemansia sp. RSA 2618]KAJ2826017.1 hypothetical protein IWW50_002575 [Coemansia erecta]